MAFALKSILPAIAAAAMVVPMCSQADNTADQAQRTRRFRRVWTITRLRDEAPTLHRRLRTGHTAVQVHAWSALSVHNKHHFHCPGIIYSYQSNEIQDDW